MRYQFLKAWKKPRAISEIRTWRAPASATMYSLLTNAKISDAANRPMIAAVVEIPSSIHIDPIVPRMMPEELIPMVPIMRPSAPASTPRQKYLPDRAAIRNRPASAIRNSSGAPSFSTSREIGSRITNSSA